MNDFIDKSNALISKGTTVLNLCGTPDDKYTKMFTDLGATVTCVDKKIGIDLVNYIKDMPDFDIIFFSYGLHYFSRDYAIKTLLPALKAHGKIIAIATFYNNPDPDFTHAMTTWYPADFHGHGTFLFDSTRDSSHKGLDGTVRHWYITEVIYKT